MYEHSSVNTAAALREARRKKILENSANRLKLIEGINLTHSKTSTESILEPKVKVKAKETNTTLKKCCSPEINSKLNDIITSNNELENITDFLLRDFSSAHEDENVEEEVVIDGHVSTGQRKKNVCFQLLLKKRLHYVILALSVNILMFYKVGYLFYENIFCPFYTVKTVELISRGRGKEDFQPILFLFITCLPEWIQKFTKMLLSVSSSLVPDLCIYLFTFIVGAKIMNMED